VTNFIDKGRGDGRYGLIYLMAMLTGNAPEKNRETCTHISPAFLFFYNSVENRHLAIF
jgi:hypothetical protein